MLVKNTNLHASVVLEIDGVIVAFDPIFINPATKAKIPKIKDIIGKTPDIICISHDHFDHYSKEAVLELAGPSTVIIAPTSCSQVAHNHKNALLKEPGDKIAVRGLEIDCLPAYNTTKQFHKKSMKYLGYLICGRTEKFYFPGDTENIPELGALKGEDIVVCVPTEGTYTMNPEEAAELAKGLGAKATIPMHFLGQDPKAIVSAVRAAGAPNVLFVGQEAVEVK